MKQPKRKYLSYAKWGYIFIIPFFLSFFIFSLIPLVDTIRYSFYEYYRSGIKEIGPNFVGLENYRSLLESDLLKYAGNTLILWLIGFVPQIVIALLLANWFTDMRLKIRGKQFFKVVIYSQDKYFRGNPHKPAAHCLPSQGHAVRYSSHPGLVLNH